MSSSQLTRQDQPSDSASQPAQDGGPAALAGRASTSFSHDGSTLAVTSAYSHSAPPSQRTSPVIRGSRLVGRQGARALQAGIAPSQEAGHETQVGVPPSGLVAIAANKASESLGLRRRSAQGEMLEASTGPGEAGPSRATSGKVDVLSADGSTDSERGPRMGIAARRRLTGSNESQQAGTSSASAAPSSNAPSSSHNPSDLSMTLPSSTLAALPEHGTPPAHSTSRFHQSFTTPGTPGSPRTARTPGASPILTPFARARADVEAAAVIAALRQAQDPALAARIDNAAAYSDFEDGIAAPLARPASAPPRKGRSWVEKAKAATLHGNRAKQSDEISSHPGHSAGVVKDDYFAEKSVNAVASSSTSKIEVPVDSIVTDPSLFALSPAMGAAAPALIAASTNGLAVGVSTSSNRGKSPAVSRRSSAATLAPIGDKAGIRQAGIRRAEALRELDPRSQGIIFALVCAWGAVLCLDRLTTYSYQTIATNSFAAHSSLSFLNVVRALVAAIAGPPFALVADSLGRANAFTLGLAFYASGHALLAASHNTAAYAGGVTLFEIGANGLVVLQWTLLADMTSSKNRLLFVILPQMPFLIFSFISANIYAAVLPHWRWGVGMFAILGPATLVPLIAMLYTAEASVATPSLPAPPRARQRPMSRVNELLQVVDLPGLVLLCAALSLLLIPLTLAASTPGRWASADIIAELCSGAALVVAFAAWELKGARFPLLPRALLMNRTAWAGALTLASFWISNTVLTAYLPTYLYVVQDTSNRAQQNISTLYSFTVALASLPVALTVRYAGRLKPFAVIGIVLFTVGLGMMVGFNGNSGTRFHIIAAQIIIGLGGAFTVAVVQSLIQVSVPHALCGQSIAVLNICINLGVAVGSALAGAMWTGLLPGYLAQELRPISGLSMLSAIFSEPLTWITEHAVSTSERTAVVAAYVRVFRYMMVAATSNCALAFAAACLLGNPKLGNTLSTVEGEDGSARSVRGESATSTDAKSINLLGDAWLARLDRVFMRASSRPGEKKKRGTPDPSEDSAAAQARFSKDALYSKAASASPPGPEVHVEPPPEDNDARPARQL